MEWEMTGVLGNKVALVTGAGSGIGRATALAFADAGASVVLVGRRVAPLEDTAAGFNERQFAIHGADVTKEADVVTAVERAHERFGRLDICVHAAGSTFEAAPIHELSEEGFRNWLDSYLVSAFLIAKHCARAFLDSGGGSLIVVGTFVGHTKALPGTSGYAAAKSGLFGLIRTVAIEYAPQNIRANMIVSGAVDTPMFRLWMDSDEKQSWAAQLSAMKRVERAEEIAKLATFLASDSASYITGSAVEIDGGLSLT
jgi:NAD(P)-dependent dehydrogenase (short-subunit alcohol dehydrogenase family)